MQVTATPDSSEEISSRIIEALAAVTHKDPLSMTPTLYEVIDPDALDRLLDTDQPVEVQFDYDGHAVVAESDGTVSVDGVVFNVGEEISSAEQY